MFEALEIFSRSTLVVSGIGLIGLMVVHTNARGKPKLVGLELGPVFDPAQQKTGRLAAWTFGVFVALTIGMELIKAL